MKNLKRFIKSPVNAYFLVTTILIFYLIRRDQYRSDDPEQSKKQGSKQQMNSAEHPLPQKSYLQDLSDPFKKFPKVVPHACVNISQSYLQDVWSVMCVNNPDFNDIGREIFFNHQWESWLTNHIVKGMINYPSAVLLDIGSNIGPHSLTVAGMEREVVVLDAVYYNLALISMSHKMTNKGKIKILYNSISDKEGEELYPYLEGQHQHMAGATYLVSKESLDSGKYKWDEVIGPPAVSVTTRQIFNDISSDVIIIKIDVEGHECKALPNDILNRSTGKYVPYIFMEWANLRLNRHHTCDQYQEFLKSFIDNGYFPHKADSSLVPVTLETHIEWFDVIWIHKDALPIVEQKV